jgi:hypothetical protein
LAEAGTDAERRRSFFRAAPVSSSTGLGFLCGVRMKTDESGWKNPISTSVFIFF